MTGNDNPASQTNAKRTFDKLRSETSPQGFFMVNLELPKPPEPNREVIDQFLRSLDKIPHQGIIVIGTYSSVSNAVREIRMSGKIEIPPERNNN